MVHISFLLTVCLAREIWCRELKEQGDNGAIFPSTHYPMHYKETRNENIAAHADTEWALDYNPRKPASLKGSLGQVTTMGSEWWHRYASTLRLNRSEGLWARQFIREAPVSVRSYGHLDALILDLVIALRLDFLRVYTNGSLSEMSLMQRVARRPIPYWAVWSCSGFPPTPEPPNQRAVGQGLVVVLCDIQTTVNLLTQAAMTKGLRQHVWLLMFPLHDDSLRAHAPYLNVPIDSQVLQVTGDQEGDGSFITLSEVWSPGSDLPLKSGFVGLWTGDSEFRGKDIDDPWAIATDRLRLYPKTKYERRKDLSGVHFIITSMNDTRAHKSYFDKALGRDMMTGYFGDVWELLKGDMNFTYSVVTPADGLFGALEEGEWTGMVGDLLAGRAHVVVAHFSLTYDRAQVVDYSSVLIQFSYRIFARPPAKSGHSWSSYTRPLSMGVWLGLALTIVLLATIFFSISQWHLRQEVRKTTAGEEKKVISLADPRKVSRYRLWKKDALMLVWAALTQQGKELMNNGPAVPQSNSILVNPQTKLF